MQARRIITSIAIAAASMFASGTVHADLVAYWSFDSNFAATVGGPEYNGMSYNGASIDTNNSVFDGGSLKLNRQAQQYVLINQAPFTGGSYSYSAWYYLDVPAVTGDNRYFILETGDGTPPSAAGFMASYGLRNRDGNQVGNVFTLQIGTATQSYKPDREFDINPGANQQWHNIVVTYDAEMKTVAAYLDGEFAGSITLTNPLINPTFMVIGAHRNITGRNFHGWIDDVAVWDHALSHEEIAQLQYLPPNMILVPEPASLALLGLGAALVLKRRR